MHVILQQNKSIFFCIVFSFALGKAILYDTILTYEYL